MKEQYLVIFTFKDQDGFDGEHFDTYADALEYALEYVFDDSLYVHIVKLSDKTIVL